MMAFAPFGLSEPWLVEYQPVFQLPITDVSLILRAVIERFHCNRILSRKNLLILLLFADIYIAVVYFVTDWSKFTSMKHSGCVFAL